MICTPDQDEIDFVKCLKIVLARLGDKRMTVSRCNTSLDYCNDVCDTNIKQSRDCYSKVSASRLKKSGEQF